MIAFLSVVGFCIGCGSSTESARNEVDRNAPSGVGPTSSTPLDPVAAEDVPDAGVTRQSRLDDADRLLESGKFDAASEALRRLLVADPQDAEVLFRLANLQALRGNLDDAIRLLDAIPREHPAAGLPALGQSADWCVQLGKFDEAEQRYLAILELAPGAPMAHRQLAQLYNRQGRRHEAARHIRELCKQGNIRQDELHALINLSDAMVGESGEGGSIDYSPIGASGKARRLFTERRYSEAAEALRETVRSGHTPPAVLALYGRALAEAQDDRGFLDWLSLTDDSTRKFSEYWAAVGAYLVSQQQLEPAIRALLEAIDRDPTDFLSLNRLLRTLKALDRPQLYESWKQRWTSLTSAVTANNNIPGNPTPNLEAMDELASHLNQLDRKLEAILWKTLETHYRGLPPEAMAHWNRQRQKSLADGEAFPDRAERLCGMRLDAYPTPDLASLVSASTPSDSPPPDLVSSPPSRPHSAAFRNIADEIGLNHRYQVAVEKRESGFTMYQQAGGGVAVLDYDRDGLPDLYLAQGAADPPDFVGVLPNQLLRATQAGFQDRTADALDEENRYTIGCTAGDWNQDGFADLIVANLGFNHLLINQGDGTFTTHRLDGSDSLERMPASVAMGDLNGDQLPDLFEANYIEDPQIARTPERDAEGVVTEPVGPGDFTPAADRIGLNDGSGGVVWSLVGDGATESYTGLGVVIADFDADGRNDVFVGNDKHPNQLWVRDPSTGQWSDVAALSGNAYSFRGASTASMGIAAGDFDRSGTIDLHVTNFQNEPVCLYLNRGSFFQDRASQYGLDQVSRSVLGFGSQSIDYDNDGKLDLVVTNGHIDNTKSLGGEFRQPPQLFSNLGDRFEIVDVADPSGYWSRKHLGRGLARLDINQDGKNDVVITHLGAPSALLLNESAAENHWLQLQLVGVDSERDAVGASVTLHADDRKLTEWVTGGDGYLARNEAVVSFGLGDASMIDQIVIRWPSGNEQMILDAASDQRILVVEGTAEPFSLFQSP